MKRIIFLFAMIFGWLSSYAAIDCVAVYDRYDEVSIIPIRDASEISFEAEVIYIGSYSFNMNLLKRYEFADSSTLGIEEINGDIPGLKIDPKGVIMFDSSLSKHAVEVWNVSGVAQPFVRNGNTVDISRLPSAVYVVKIGQATIKILRR